MIVKVKGFSGVACYVRGPVKVWEQNLAYFTDTDSGEDFEDFSDEPGDGEWILDDTRLRVVMVGDDHEYIVDRDDCAEIGDSEFCHECGQIGCAHGAYPEDDGI